MKKITKKLNTGRGFYLSLITIILAFFNITNATGQAVKPDLGNVDPIVQGLIVKYKINVKLGDTVYSRIELSPSLAFPFPQVFYKRTMDTTKNFTDTITEKMGLAPAPAQYYLRVWSVSKNGKDSLVSSVEIETTLEPIKNPILKIVQVLPNKDGAYFTLNTFSGNSTDTMRASYKYSYNNINFFPNGNRKFVGTKNGYQDSVWGMFANKDTWLNISYINSNNKKFDTTIFFKTALQPQKAVITITSVTAGIDYVEIKGDIATFNVNNRLVVHWNSGKDSIEIGNFKSLKAEPFSVKISNLPSITNITGTIVGNSTYGKSIENWNSKTLEMPMKPKITVNVVYIKSGGISMNWGWQTNSNELFKRFDAKFYSDSMETTPAKVTKISDGSSNISGTENSNIDIDPGLYWVRLTGETSKGDYTKSNLFMFTVKFSAEIKVAKEIPIGEKDWMIINTLGQLVSEHYTKDLSVRLSDQNLPFGVIYASTMVKGNYLKFKVFNYGGE